MSRKSVVLNNGKEVAFGFDKYPFGYYLQVFKPAIDEDDVPEEREGLTKGQWLDACSELLDTKELAELHIRASEAVGALLLDLDINGQPFNGDLNVRPL